MKGKTIFMHKKRVRATTVKHRPSDIVKKIDLYSLLALKIKWGKYAYKTIGHLTKWDKGCSLEE